MRQYEVFELILKGAEPDGSWIHVDVDAEFRLNGTVTRVRGFYMGGGEYGIRFYPDTPGKCSYIVKGAVWAEGEEEVLPAFADSHGRVQTRGTHFAFEDKTPYLPFGTTVYAMLHQDQELMERTFRTLAESPFNKLRLCVFPIDFLYNKNEPEDYPFEGSAGRWKVHRPCMSFWSRLEETVRRLARMQIQTDLILFHPYDHGRWGFDEMTEEQNQSYLEYLLRRLSAFPSLWWSMANEYDVCRKKVEEWYQVEAFMAQGDPFHHLLSCHNCYKFWDMERRCITHASLQTKLIYCVGELKRRTGKPVIVDECCYEGNVPETWGCISGQELTRRFWRAAVSGAYCTHGEAFLDPQNIMWWTRGGILKGESVPRIAFLKKLMEELPRPLEPIPCYVERLKKLAGASPEEQAKAAEADPGMRMVRPFAGLGDEMELYASREAEWKGRCGDEAFLVFYDMRCYGEDVLELPENRTYTLELIDVWNMTRIRLADGATGSVRLRLPGKENMAVLALACTQST